jgi:hypothetical protein
VSPKLDKLGFSIKALNSLLKILPLFVFGSSDILIIFFGKTKDPKVETNSFSIFSSTLFLLTTNK